MNYLAHIYLSGESELIRIGNFMADGIRGKDYQRLHPEIQKGILLHREIDTYTDQHPVFRQGTKRLHEKYHHYAGVIMDMFYDHFLAANWPDYSSQALDDFSQDFYRSLEQNQELLTEKVRGFMPYMIRYDWLGSYQTVDGIARILAQMDQRSRNQSGMSDAWKDLEENYDAFGAEFRLFFEELRAHSKSVLEKL